MHTAPALGEFLGPRPRQLPEARITRSSAHESEAADQQAPITIKAVRCAGDTIDEIEAPLDRCLAAGDLVSCFGHWQSPSRRGMCLNSKSFLGRPRSGATNRSRKCRSTAEQEAVATWPIRITRLTAIFQEFETGCLPPRLNDSRWTVGEPTRSLPLPVLRLSVIVRMVQSRQLKTVPD